MRPAQPFGLANSTPGRALPSPPLRGGSPPPKKALSRKELLGWDQLIVDALTEIAAVSQSSGVKIQIGQIKEKFGGLRIYVDVNEDSNTDFELVESKPGHDRFRTGATPGSARGGTSDRRRCSATCSDRLRSMRCTGNHDFELHALL